MRALIVETISYEVCMDVPVEYKTSAVQDYKAVCYAYIEVEHMRRKLYDI